MTQPETMKRITIYVDGACSGNPGPGGYAARLEWSGNIREISGGFAKTTNNRMELIAVVKALEILTERCYITVYSDSTYLVNSMDRGHVQLWRDRGWMRSQKEAVPNSDLWERLLQLCKQHNIKFRWVKGHSNDSGNNRCDYLARQAILQEPLEKDIVYEAKVANA